MKKFKKPLTLNKLVISKLSNPTSIMGGSQIGICDPKTKSPLKPLCQIDPSSMETNCPSVNNQGC